jgi:hypothetical protein
LGENRRNLFIILSRLGGIFLIALFLNAQEQVAADRKIRVLAASASIRISASETSRVIASLPKGTILNSYESYGIWLRVVLPPSKEGIVVIGYIAKSDVEILEERIQKPRDFWGEDEEKYVGAGIHLKLAGGLAFFRSGDIDQGAKGLYEIGAKSVAARGVDFLGRSVKPITSGIKLSCDVVYDLSRRIGVGVGVGYTTIRGDDIYRYSQLAIYQNSMDSATNLKVLTLRLGIFYTIPLGRLINIHLNAGPAVFVTDFTYSRSDRGSGFEESLNIAGKATSLGFQGGVELDLRLLERVSLFFDLQGRYAKISNFQGSEQTAGRENDIPIPSVQKSGTIYFVPDTPYPRLAVFPVGSSVAAGARNAVFDFTGADLVTGIRIRF